MNIITKVSDFENFIASIKSKNQSIGFVPTMGALHYGHLSLIKKSKTDCDITIASIFVNPKQFNNQTDFEKYPIQIDHDVNLLENVACDVLFLPNKDEIYSSDFIMPSFNLGKMNEVMEGKFRPGHFEGVITVVYRLFELVKPNKAYFGLKDFQQLAVIKKMTEYFHLPIEIVPCTTIREKDGLALSSRNLRLDKMQRIEALFIYQSLILCKELVPKNSPLSLKKLIEDLYIQSSLKLEYIEFINPIDLTILEESWVQGAVACIVAYCGEVRLIDNMCVFECV